MCARTRGLQPRAQAASQLQTCSSSGCQQAAGSLPPRPSSPSPSLLSSPRASLPSLLLEEHSEAAARCWSLCGGISKGAEWPGCWWAPGSLERWLHAPAAGTEAAMEILLIIRFCCNCTYGNPGARCGRRRTLPPLGAGWSGLKCVWRGLRATGKEGGQVAGPEFPLRFRRRPA